MAVPFSDPPNLKDLIDSFPKGDPREVLRYTNHVLPGWIIDYADQFSIDLLRFNVDWADACVKLNIPPQKVILVKDTFLTKQRTTHKLIRKSVSSLLCHGFIVMDMTNFDKCKQCGFVICSKTRLEQNGFSFSGKCQSCFKYDPTKNL
jgi:hypothetical protein